MRICIDGHCIGDKSGGNETYWVNLIKYITEYDRENNYKIMLNKDINLTYEIHKNTELDYFKSKNTFKRNIIELPSKIKNEKFDLLHTQYFSPFGIGNKNIVTIHDISFEHYPECFSKKELIIDKFLVKQAAIKSKAIITVSEFSKRDIVKKYGVNPEKVHVTYLGANESFKVIANEDSIQEVLKKYNINSKYLLAVGNLQPRKNLGRLIEAFKQLKKDDKYNNYKLVLVGKKAWKNENILFGVNIEDIKKDIVITGYVPDEDLPFLYNGASIFIYPSIFEGFGLPPLEAMSCGAVVITSNITSMPEVVGDSGILFNPFDVKDLLINIKRVLNDEKLMSSYKKKSVERSKRFTWQNTAEQTIKIYENMK